MSLESVYQEVFITKSMSDLSADRNVSFIKCHKFCLAKGEYSAALLKAWDLAPSDESTERPGN